MRVVLGTNVISPASLFMDKFTSLVVEGGEIFKGKLRRMLEDSGEWFAGISKEHPLLVVVLEVDSYDNTWCIRVFGITEFLGHESLLSDHRRKSIDNFMTQSGMDRGLGTYAYALYGGHLELHSVSDGCHTQATPWQGGDCAVAILQLRSDLIGWLATMAKGKALP